MASAAPPNPRWLFGPVPDLLFGCGVAYAAVFLLLSVAGDPMRAVLPIALVPLFNLVTSAPHYGATLMRVYERREDRRAYAVFAVWISIALALVFAWGLRSAVVGSLLLTIYLTWSPWHYSGQNYGIALVFLRRRGVEVTPATKRLLYASFLLSFALTFLVLHGGAPVASYAPQGLGGLVYRLLPLGIPAAVIDVAMPGVGLLYAAVLVATAVQLLRKGSLRDLTPTAVLIATQALWFSAPVLARYFGVLGGIEPLGLQHAEYAFVWVVSGHAVQYLWITAYYAAASKRSKSRLGFYLKALAAGVSLWTVPTLIFAPGLLGRLPYDAGLGLLVASVVNIHHFILDGAIWKLREGRIARVLIRSAGEAATPAAPGTPRRSWGWPAVAVVGSVCVAVTVAWVFEDQYGFRRAAERGDWQRAEQATRRLGWIGRSSAEYPLRIALAKAQAGELEAAGRQVQSSLDLHATPRARLLEGQLHRRRGDWSAALRAFEEAASLDPSLPAAHYEAGVAWIELGDLARARARLKRALELAPGTPRFRKAMARLYGLELRTRGDGHAAVDQRM